MPDLKTPLRILLVEDSPTDSLLIRSLLQKSDCVECHFQQVESLANATELVLLGNLDVVLLDLNLSDSRGIDTIREFVEVSLFPVIVVTNLEDKSIRQEAFKLSVQDLIFKRKVTLPILEQVILSTLERYEAEQHRKAAITELIDANLNQARVARKLEELNKILEAEIKSKEEAQRAFEESESRFRSIFEESPMPLWEMDLSRLRPILNTLKSKHGDLESYFRMHGGEIVRLVSMIRTVDISKATLKVFKARSKEEMLERFTSTLTPQAFRQMAHAFSAFAEGDLHYETETFFTSLEDENLEVLFRWVVIPGHEQALSRVLLSTVDITKIKQSERQRRLLSTAIEQSVETIIVTDEKGIIQYANPAFEKITGQTRSEVVLGGQSFLQNLPDKEELNRKILSTLSRGEVWSGRIHGVSKDGAPLEEEATISPIFDETSRITNFVAVKRDVTKLAGLERQLRQSQKLEAIGQLAAGIAHEINTPIQYVGDNIKFLAEALETYSNLMSTVIELKDKIVVESEVSEIRKICSSLEKEIEEADLEFYEEEVPQAVRQSLDGGSRISNIVSAMKQFAHPGTDTKNAQDLTAALNSTITVAKNEWKYVADVETNFDANLPLVPCYLGELNQVFLNMIVNAAHAIEGRQDRNGKKGTITVGTRLAGEYAEVTIRDTGMGIPEKNRDRVFDPFFTTKTVGKGTGQGLAIAYSTVVDKHNGEILIDSEVGEGTTFTIRLPMSDEAQEV